MAQGQAPGREQTRSRLGRGPSRDLPDEHDQVEGGSMILRYHAEILALAVFGALVIACLS